MIIEERMKWLLVILQKANYIEGRTRLQKLAFLVRKSNKGLSSQEFYNDWEAGRYGPFSRILANDLETMLKEELIHTTSVLNEYGYKVSCFEVDEKGKKIVDDIVKQFPEKAKNVEGIVKEYAQAPLMELLYDIYHQFPEYAKLSEIKAEVNYKASYKDTILSEQYDEPD